MSHSLNNYIFNHWHYAQCDIHSKKCYVPGMVLINKVHVDPSPCRDRTYKEKQKAMGVRGKEREKRPAERLL